MVAYRAEVIVWILTSTLPLVMLAVWDRVAQDGAVQGFGQGDFARYFAVALVVRQLTGTWVVWELNQQIRTGSLSAALLKPTHPLAWFAAESLATMPIRAVVLIPLIAVIALWRPEMGVGFEPANAPAFVLSVLLAFGVHFLVQTIFGCLAFWLDQSLGLFNVWFAVWALFSGYIAPIALMPDGLRAAVEWLPFRALLGIPVEIGAGLATGPAVWSGLLVQLSWLASCAVLAAFVWRRGVLRYGAVGA